MRKTLGAVIHWSRDNSLDGNQVYVYPAWRGYDLETGTIVAGGSDQTKAEVERELHEKGYRIKRK